MTLPLPCDFFFLLPANPPLALDVSGWLTLFGPPLPLEPLLLFSYLAFCDAFILSDMMPLISLIVVTPLPFNSGSLAFWILSLVFLCCPFFGPAHSM